MINVRPIEEELLTNEEQAIIIKKQKIEIENLKFQVLEYQQIVKELSDKISSRVK